MILSVILCSPSQAPLGLCRRHVMLIADRVRLRSPYRHADPEHDTRYVVFYTCISSGM